MMEFVVIMLIILWFGDSLLLFDRNDDGGLIVAHEPFQFTIHGLLLIKQKVRA